MILRTHLAFSFFIALLLFEYIPFFHNTNAVVFFSIFLFSSFLPDIDSGKSFFGRKVKLVSFFFRHRSIFHSFWIPLSALIFLYPVNAGFAIIFFLGYSSHLLLDMLNCSGIYAFYPFFRIKGFVRAGSLFDSLIFYAFFIFDIFFVVFLI